MEQNILSIFNDQEFGNLFALAFVLTFGINFLFWGAIGIIRSSVNFVSAVIKRRHSKRYRPSIKKVHVAVMVPAHNEELVIADTIVSLIRIIKREHIYIISDNSNDRTVEIARRFKVNVLVLHPGRGKAGALEEGIRHFNLIQRYEIITFVDADTRLKSDYFTRGLAHFDDAEVIAVAGHAQTIWKPEKLSWMQMLFLLHRDRVYFFTQMVVKFGQAWKHTNVCSIVPGFASMYRTSIIHSISMNPPGLVIEDFNMTFEVHHKELGKIIHDPDVVGYTQDPDNFHDYFRQVKRWHLGFWQTIRLHGFWPSKFWLALALTVFETLLGSIVFIVFPVLLIIAVIPFDALFPQLMEYSSLQNIVILFFFGLLAADYFLTMIVALEQERIEYLAVGLFFPILRLFDAVAYLLAIPRAFLTRSDGRWTSPSRRSS